MSDSNLVPQLVELNGPHAGRVHALPFGEHVIGRGAGATIQLEHKDVSRQHARLEVSLDGILVHDLGSKNGVYANGAKIEAPTVVTHGALLAFGDLQVTVGHPASQVSKALLAAGEATMTTSRADESDKPALSALLFPMLGVVVFGGLVAALLLL